MITTDQNQNVGSMLGQAGLNFLGNLINAKQQGVKLPKVFDTVATVAMQGENKAMQIAKQEAKKQAITKGAWVLVAVLLVIIGILIYKKNN